MKEENLRVVFMTAPSIDVARDISRKLVEAKLAACVNIVPGIESIYSWEGHIEQSTEVLLVAKTSQERFSSLERCVLESHPYEVPEIVSLAADKVFERYLSWVRSETTKA